MFKLIGVASALAAAPISASVYEVGLPGSIQAHVNSGSDPITMAARFDSANLYLPGMVHGSRGSIAELAAPVWTFEIAEEFASADGTKLDKRGHRNVAVRIGDG